MKKTLATLAATSMLTLGGAVALATPAHADPINCTADVSGSPGNSSFTLHINANPCRYPMRAWGECTLGELGLGAGEWSTTSGTTEAYSGAAVASCGAAFIENYYYGYDQYYGGAWHRYNMYFDEWDS